MKPPSVLDLPREMGIVTFGYSRSSGKKGVLKARLFACQKLMNRGQCYFFSFALAAEIKSELFREKTRQVATLGSSFFCQMTIFW